MLDDLILEVVFRRREGFHDFSAAKDFGSDYKRGRNRKSEIEQPHHVQPFVAQVDDAAGQVVGLIQ